NAVILLVIVASFLQVSLLTCASHEPTAVLTWRDTSKNEDGFRIYRIVGKERTKLAEVKANVTRYVDKDPVPKACYIVTAFNAAGESSATNVVCLPGILEPGKTYSGRGD
ncbi:MAG TPA: hypothetical protein VK632_02545, partial [Verrucomicrobiae bacterium]|nr:hypothetical protein [Verrucomicrobiae bacterium]